MNANGLRPVSSFLPPGVVLARAAYRSWDVIGWPRMRPLPSPSRRALERVEITQVVIVAAVPRTTAKKSAGRTFTMWNALPLFRGARHA